MNISFWIKALVFAITLIPCFIVGIYAYLNDSFDLLNWILLTICLVFARGYYVVANEWNWNKAKGIHTLLVIIGKHTALVVLISLYWYFTRIMKIYLSEKPKECPDNYLRTVRPLWYVAFAFLSLDCYLRLYLN